jgi:hypothetical protein
MNGTPARLGGLRPRQGRWDGAGVCLHNRGDPTVGSEQGTRSGKLNISGPEPTGSRAGVCRIRSRVPSRVVHTPECAGRGYRQVGTARKGSVRTTAELAQTSEPLEVFGTGPHPPPTVALGRKPSTRPGRRLAAVGRLQLVAVDHPPALVRPGDEAGARVAGLGHRGHGVRG